MTEQGLMEKVHRQDGAWGNAIPRQKKILVTTTQIADPDSVGNDASEVEMDPATEEVSVVASVAVWDVVWDEAQADQNK